MTQLLTHTTNTITSAVTTFDGYGFNSLAHFQGKYLGAGTTGLVWLDNPASTEAPTATMTTGQLHFGSELQKRVSEFFLAMRADSDITLRITTDESATTYEYTISPLDVDTLKQRRVKTGKGMKGKYWTFELECADSFDYDSMNIAVALTERRL